MIVPVYENKELAEWSFIDEETVEIRFLNSSLVIEVDFEKQKSAIWREKVFISGEYDCFEIVNVFEFMNQKYYIYVENSLVKISNRFSIDEQPGIKVDIEFRDTRFFTSMENSCLMIKDRESDWTYTVDERLFSQKGAIMDDMMSYDGDIPGLDNPYLYFRATVGKYNLFYEVYRQSKRYAMKYLKLRMLSTIVPENVKIEAVSFNLLKISIGENTFFEKRDGVNLSSKIIGYLEEVGLPHPIFFEANGKFFAISNNQGSLLIENADKDDYFIEEFDPHCVRVSGKIYCFGKLKFAHDITSLNLKTVRTGSNMYIDHLHRKGNYFSFSINLDDAEKVKNFHNRIWLGNLIHRLKVKKNFPEPQNKLVTNFNNCSVFMRLNDAGILSLTVVPKSTQYKLVNRLKQALAYYSVRLKKKFFHYEPKVNLYFEKDCSRAEESAIRVFQNVMEKKQLRSNNFFILDERAPYFQQLKNEYKKNLVRRFSFKHYYLIFSATHLISSELSNHVVEVRVLNEKLSRKINSTPLYFLQHGIMFAKPVENPMARGFYKSDMTFSLKKSVISSDLEAGEFYKMGYNDSELMKTGLATFDYAKRNNNADKIVFMPTYRYWEEKAIISGQIRETTYFFSIMEVIKAFEEQGLISHLLITPHNKFSEYIVEFLPEYRNIICSNPSEALKQSCIFISDYSSAIYDAIYRGAYPIFYWKDEDYLIQNYQAVPPVNSENAPGVIAYNENQLLNCVKNAIELNFTIEPENLEKYRKINEFHDGKNTERIIEILIDDLVL